MREKRLRAWEGSWGCVYVYKMSLAFPFEWRINVDFDLISLVRKKVRDRGMG